MLQLKILIAIPILQQINVSVSTEPNQLFKELPAFMESERLHSCSQKTAVAPNPETVESHPNAHTPFL
jgi:hypothetical protein